jgi:hypothetical protein
MSIYFVNIPIIVVGLAIVLSPLMRKWRRREHARQATHGDARDAHSRFDARRDEKVDDLHYVG